MHHEVTSLKTNARLSLGLIPLCMTCLLTGGCSQSPPIPEVTLQPTQTTVKVELPHAELPDGFSIDLELAVTPQEVSDGLMYRPSLRENRGMLFLFETDRYPSFWMKNTLIPLDIVFLDSRGFVVDVAAGVPPCAADPCPTYSPQGSARAVLEVAAGVAEAHGLVAGSPIIFQGVTGYPVPDTEQ